MFTLMALFSLVLILYGCFLCTEYFPIFKVETGDEINFRFFLNKISIQFYAGLTFILFSVVNLIER